MGRARKANQSRYWQTAAVLVAVLSGGCFSPVQPTAPPLIASAPSAVHHRVQPGETIYHIAHSYNVTPARLMAANELSDPRELRVGQVLVIPSAFNAGSAAAEGWPSARIERPFLWPVTAGQISSPFGLRNGVMHDGVDIVAPAGTPVHAADDGVVLFAGRIHGYGNAVLLQHARGYVTVYGHNRRNLVHSGDRVVRGQVIAELGSTGRATGPNLHFEVRDHGKPQNPLAYLPEPPLAGSISFARNGGS